MKKYYIIYEVIKDKEGNIIDLFNLWDDKNPQRLCEKFGISYNNISLYTSKSLNNIKCKLKDNKYFIFKGHTNLDY